MHICLNLVKTCLYFVSNVGHISGVYLRHGLPANPKQGRTELDAVGSKILTLLQEDCKLSYNKIAAKVGVSVGTAYNRIKALERAGLIKGYSLIVDSAKAGYSLTALIFVQAEGGHLSALEKQIAQLNSVVAVYDVTGEFDALVIGKFKNRDELSEFIKHLAGKPYVKRTATSVSLNTIKEDFRL